MNKQIEEKEEVKKIIRKQTEGEWKADKSITIRVYETDSITCSACGEHSHGNISSGGYPNYCPKCGAKMKGGEA